ncbi:MAG: triose-phosphate isomerase [Phenylobacterium sp.]|nr:triose-phosphate isomerase [Phenylobacterium sp.]
MSAPIPLIAGNWKMNGTGPALAEASAIAAGAPAAGVRVALCPPATLVERMSRALAGSPVELGGQDCHAQPGGAFTGDISAEMLADAGASLVILGHSERRAGHDEGDADVAAKVSAALKAGLEPIVCVGETQAEREAGQALEVVTRQVRASLPAELAGRVFTLAYEPVWAIGTGLTPSLQDIVEVHQAIRATLRDMFGQAGAAPAILYGGSVKPGNAAEILALPEVGGALVGGASLKAAEFLAIVEGAPRA